MIRRYVVSVVRTLQAADGGHLLMHGSPTPMRFLLSTT